MEYFRNISSILRCYVGCMYFDTNVLRGDTGVQWNRSIMCSFRMYLQQKTNHRCSQMEFIVKSYGESCPARK